MDVVGIAEIGGDRHADARDRSGDRQLHGTDLAEAQIVLHRRGHARMEARQADQHDRQLRLREGLAPRADQRRQQARVVGVARVLFALVPPHARERERCERRDTAVVQHGRRAVAALEAQPRSRRSGGECRRMLPSPGEGDGRAPSRWLQTAIRCIARDATLSALGPQPDGDAVAASVEQSGRHGVGTRRG